MDLKFSVIENKIKISQSYSEGNTHVDNNSRIWGIAWQESPSLDVLPFINKQEKVPNKRIKTLEKAHKDGMHPFLAMQLL